MQSFLYRVQFHIKAIFFRIFTIIKFGNRVRIDGDPRKVKLGKGCTFQSGVLIYTYGGTVQIGDYSEIHHGVILNASGGTIVIGTECSINPYTIIYGEGNTIIGNGVRIAAHSVIVSSNHSFEVKDIPIRKQGFTKLGIAIEDDVWIGAGVKILDGVVIRKGAVIGAGAVVTTNIPEFAVCVGVPAKVIKYRT